MHKLYRTIFTLGAMFLCVVLVPGSAAGKNLELNNNYYGKLADWQKELLANNTEHHLLRAAHQVRSGNAHLIPYAKDDLHYMLIRWVNHPKALQLVTEIALRTHDPNYANKWFQKAIDAYPRVYQTYMLYGIFLYRDSDYAKSVKNFKKAIELKPDSSEANYDLGLALVAVHKYKEANRYAQRAYGLGYPLSGLRHKLQKAGAWKPVKDAGAGGKTPSK